MNQFKYKDNRGDYIISFAVMIQSLLIVLQHVLMDVGGMALESTTIYRVILTAIPMVFAIFYAFRKNGTRFFVVYAFVILLLLYTIMAFPQNTDYIQSDGLRFLLPVVIPSALCLMSVSDFKVVERTLYVISWGTAMLVLFYVIQFFRGVFVIDAYNMSFSYGCLLPMLTLYSHRKPIDIVVSLIMFIAVLAIGARGTAIITVAYILMDSLLNHNKSTIFIWLGIALFILLLPFMSGLFESIGINSRTLSLFFEGNIAYESGRDVIRQLLIERLMEHPFSGLGLYGDRVATMGVQSHNIILEICVDFGLFFGFFIMLFLLLYLVRLFRQSDNEKRVILFRYFSALVVPFMASGSYLVNSNFAIFIGVCYVLNKDNGRKIADRYEEHNEYIMNNN